MKNTKTYKISDILSEELANTETTSVFAYTHPIFSCMIDGKPKLLYINSDGKTLSELKYYKTSSVLNMLEQGQLSDSFTYLGQRVCRQSAITGSINRLLVIIHPSSKPNKSFVKIKKVLRFPYDYIVINLFFDDMAQDSIDRLISIAVSKLKNKFETGKIEQPKAFVDISFVSLVDSFKKLNSVHMVNDMLLSRIYQNTGYYSNNVNHYYLSLIKNSSSNKYIDQVKDEKNKDTVTAEEPKKESVDDSESSNGSADDKVKNTDKPEPGALIFDILDVLYKYM